MSKAHGDFSGKSHLLLSFTKVPWGWGRSRYWGVEEIFKIDKKNSLWLQALPPIRGGKSPTRTRQGGPCQVLLHGRPSAGSSSHVTLAFGGLLAEGDPGHG